MVIIMKKDASKEAIEKIVNKMISLGCEVHKIEGKDKCILGLIGETGRIDPSQIRANINVEDVVIVHHSFKLASRDFHPKDTIIDIDGVKIGGDNVVVIAGPCSVESEEQLMTIAKSIKKSGAHMIRGGAFKPRTSPYSFQGMGEEGLKLLGKAKEATGLPIVTEIMDETNFDTVEKYADILQIGARNMQNFSLLKRAGKSKKPILLKRGLCATLEELLMSAEYIMSKGNDKVILCERGIRTFETYTRNTLDLSAVPALKELTHLPILIDPSHATGKWSMIEPLSKAAVACGSDGLMIEVHNEPELAVSDGAQSLKPEKFEKLMRAIEKIAAAR